MDCPINTAFGYWRLEFIWLLACLREAASAKAGAWVLVIYLFISFKTSSNLRIAS
jgi:hypothetical protein